MNKTQNITTKVRRLLLLLTLTAGLIAAAGGPAYAATAVEWSVAEVSSAGESASGSAIYTTDGFTVSYASSGDSLDSPVYTYTLTKEGETTGSPKTVAGEAQTFDSAVLTGGAGKYTLIVNVTDSLTNTNDSETYTVYYGSAAKSLTGVTVSVADTGGDTVSGLTGSLSGSIYTIAIPADAYRLTAVAAAVSEDAAAKITIGSSSYDLPQTSLTTSVYSSDSYSYTLTVYPQNGDIAATYTLRLVKEDTAFDIDMLLSGDEGGTYVSKSAFDPEDTAYDVDLDSDEEELDLYVYFDDDDYEATVRYDGDTWDEEDTDDDYYYYCIDVDPDDAGTLRVAIEDLDSGETVYYYFYLDDDSSDEGAEELEDLHLNLGSSYSSTSSREIDLLPELSEDETDYVALVPYTDDYSKLNLRFSLEDEDVELEIEGDAIDLDGDDEYDYSFDLPDEGDNDTVSFSVEGVEYTLSVYFADEDADDEAYLDDLAIRSKRTTSSSYDLDLSPDFDEDEEEYAIDDDYDDYSTLYLYPEAGDDAMLVFINGVLFSSTSWSFDPDDYDEIEISVWSENLEESMTYTVSLDGGGSGSLSSLSLYTSGSSYRTLSPAFSAATYNYVTTVENSVSSIYLYAAGTDTIQVSLNGGSYASYSSSSSYSLNTGLNTFELQVGDNHYYINVYRKYLSDTIVTSSQYLSLNSGAARQIAAYNINGNNYFKLRDLASLLSGSGKQFSVSFNSSSDLVTLTGGGSYTAVGGELSIPGSYSRAQSTRQSIMLNGSYVYPTVYNIDGNNYFLLRDLAALLDFHVSFSGNTVYVNTSLSYGGESDSDDSDSDEFDIEMKLAGDEGGTYLSTSDFDPDETEYEVDVDGDDEELYLYVYFDDDDYTVSSVKLDGSSSDVSKSTKSGYNLYTIEIDPGDLDDTELTVKVKNSDGDDETWTFVLNED